MIGKLSFSVGDWYYHIELQRLCQVVETKDLWGESICLVWLPNSDTVVRVPSRELRLLEDITNIKPEQLNYIAAAARVADAITKDTLLAPIESSVIPLPHQIRALSQALSHDQIRYLLADEVGLGKTIEAGLILRELKLRGLVKRILVVAPKGIVTQWVAEMQTHFGEDFKAISPGDFSAYRRLAQDENMWKSYDQIICSMDSVKPMSKRRGWSQTQLVDYNNERFEDLISAGWDLIIVDEAHRLGGSTDQVARFKLGQGLADAAPYLLMLSATPHQGKSDAFYRLISLIDDRTFPDLESVTKDRVKQFVIRTEKRHAINAEGKPLFKPRLTTLLPVKWKKQHADQEVLYEAITQYVRLGYNQAMKEKRSYIGFLLVLMQRLVVSSTAAIRTTLERRLEILKAPLEQLSLFPDMTAEDWADLDGQQQIETLLKSRLSAMTSERAEVELLLEAARRCEINGPDAKVEALLERIHQLQNKESDSELKILIFTEFVPTQRMLKQFLSDRGFSVVTLNGSMNMEERRQVQESFAEDTRVLVSTDAGGEGLNLQFCHIVINYDIPWNPMRLEQRIGRVDRIGQNHVVQAINFVIDSSVEHRVREVLEEKLAVILEEFGVDKTGDILDTAEAGQVFDELYVDAILHPEALESHVDTVVSDIHSLAKEAYDSSSLLGEIEELDPEAAQRLLMHPLPAWLETMTVNYLLANGGSALKTNKVWDLEWPDGKVDSNIVFNRTDVEGSITAKHLSLENSRIRQLALSIPRIVKGQPIPSVSVPDLGDEIKGYWALVEIVTRADEIKRTRILPVFVHDDSRILMQTARHIWNQLLGGLSNIIEYIVGDDALNAFDLMLENAESQGETTYKQLIQHHEENMIQERNKTEFAFAARRRALNRIGLPQVRDYRISVLDQEEKEWTQLMERKSNLIPELIPILLVRITGERN